MYAVIWKTALLDRLADIYVAAEVDERERMAAGIEALNARLADDPSDVGESRVGGYRVAFTPLLRVSFHVDPVRRQVRVTDLVRIRR